MAEDEVVWFKFKLEGETWKYFDGEGQEVEEDLSDILQYLDSLSYKHGGALDIDVAVRIASRKMWWNWEPESFWRAKLFIDTEHLSYSTAAEMYDKRKFPFICLDNALRQVTDFCKELILKKRLAITESAAELLSSDDFMLLEEE